MRKAAILIATLVLFGLFGTAMTTAAGTATPTIAVDLAHGENPKGLLDVTYKNKTITPGMLSTIKDMKFVYFGDPKYEEELGIKGLGQKITYNALKGVDILIIGQPTSPFYPDEAQAIKQWLAEGGHVLWIAGDSDYGNGAKTQQFVDSLLDQLGITNLRVDLCSVEDPVSNAGGKSYRVVAFVKPSPDTPDKDMITKGLKNGGKILAHGPGVVAWVDSNGNWHPLNDSSRPKNAYIIVRTSKNGEIVENNAPAANAYQAGNTGSFPIIAVQIVTEKGKKPNVIIVSGETPIGGYEPMWVSKYYDVPLDGPTFITNFLHWSLEMAKGVPATSASAPAKTASGTSASSTGKVCGPAAIVGLAVVPLLLRRRK
ncbi:CGP-CTERM sorting domain-containing protein [Thermococcus sp.]|uniref:CGP-CTERM sorting domain-containing protein n=1 Tax=Thermococcus sp. TaxID=35749 RepID=UPI00261DC887|nr:CGP-CTERM sorting domain-containing protein [Thermococcus sp.]